MDDLDDTSRWRSSKQVGQMHDRDERLSRFRRELLVAAARVRQELQPGRSLTRTIRKSIAQAIEHWADTVDTIDDKQIAEFDAAASGIGDDEFSECIHRATFEGWEGRTAETASEFIAIVIRRLRNRHRH